MRLFYGKVAHITLAIAGIALSGYAIYYLGRSDELQEKINIVRENGSTTFRFYDRLKKDYIHINMNIN